MLTRTHEWLADHVSWMQYPRVRRMGPKPAFWRTPMPWFMRAFLVVFGFALLAACAVAAFFLVMLLWAAITA